MNTPRCRLAASIAGRLRLKFTEIHPAALAALQSDIAAIPSVREVQANAAARSLVVHYDASTPQALMEQRIMSLCGGADADQAKREPAPVVTKPTSALRSAPPAGLRRGRGHRAAWRRRANRGAKITAMLAMPLSIALVYAGNKRLHAATGWLAVAAMAVHMAIHRRNTFK